MADQTTLSELEPLLLSDNTEVKVPFVPDDNRNADIDSQLNSTNDPDQNADFVEYNRLIGLFYELPGVMFVTRILSDYNSCEQTLENIRCLLYESVKSNEDFPYDTDTELKRRVFTRKGDPVSVKLANDVYTLISVVEGDEYSNLKDMLSNSRRKQSTSSRVISGFSANTLGSRPNLNQCSCSNEITLLKDMVASLQSDLLMCKQAQAAYEALRSEEYAVITSSVSGIKDELLKFVSSIRGDMDTISRSVAEIAMSDSRSDIENLHSKINAVDSRMISIESFLDNNNVVSVEKLNISPLPKTPEYVLDSEPLVSFGYFEDYEFLSSFGNSVTPTKQSQSQAGTDMDNLEIFLSGKVETTQAQTQTRYPEMKDASVQCDQGILTKHKRASKFHVPVRKRITFADIRATIGTPSEPRCRGIPVRVTTRTDYSEDDFSPFLKKHTKRLYVGGYKAGITKSEIVNYVSGRGLKVTMIRMFPCRSRPSEVIVRLNVEADSNSDLLESRGFWPPEVVCKPWRSRGQLVRARIDPQQSHTSNTRLSPKNRHDVLFDNYDYGEYQRPKGDYNRFSELDVDVD